MSEKNLDRYERLRSITVGFRVSPEENERISAAVAMSGQTKQDYIVSKLLDRPITVTGNCKIHRVVYDRLTSLQKVLEHLEPGEDCRETVENVLECLQIIERICGKTAA